MKNSLRSFTVWAGLLTAVVAGILNLVGRSGSTEPRGVVPTVTASASTPAGRASSTQHPTSNSQPPVSSTQRASGDRLLMEAASRLARRRSVIARLRHQVFIHDEQLFGVGYYWQEGRGDDLKVRLELQIAGQVSRLLQVSNSRFQWQERSLPTGRTVSRVDLRQLRAVLAAENGNEVRPGEASWSPVHTDFTANCGGLPRLLAALSENFSFLPPQAMRLVPAPGSEASGVPFFAVIGHWKPEKLATLIGTQEPAAESRVGNAHPTPEHVRSPDYLPQEVLLLVDQAELFPYRIEYRPLETPVAAANGRPVPYQLSPRPLVVLEFSNVVFDVAVAASQFDYTPPNVDWVDQTAAVLDRLRRERQETVAIHPTLPQQALPAR